MKIAVALLAFALVVGACASDPDEETTTAGDDSTEESSETSAQPSTSAADDPDASSDDSGDDAAPVDDPADDQGDDSAMEDDTADDDPAGGSPVAGLLISGVLGQAGVEPTDEIVACVEDRGIDLDLAPTATEEEVAEATLAIFGCAPEELGQVLAADTVAPPGTDTDDVACVIAETFRYLSELPTDEALAALEADTPPQEIRDDLGPIAEQNCGLDPDQVDAILDS